MKKFLIITAAFIISGIATAATALYLPFPITAIEQSGHGKLTPFGEITANHPLEQCLTAGSEYSDGNEKDLSFEILAATYNRQNTSHYSLSFFSVENGQQDILATHEIAADRVVDNDYLIFPLENFESEMNELCYLLTSKDSTPENSITVWTNSQNEPVLKLKTKKTLLELVREVSREDHFRLGETAVLGLFLIYIGSLLIFVTVFFYLVHEIKEVPQSQHHQGARYKRV